MKIKKGKETIGKENKVNLFSDLSEKFFIWGFVVIVNLGKERYRNHTRYFKHEKYENCTESAKYIWQLKGSNINFSIKYSIASPVSGSPSSIICPLRITENLWIIKFLNNKDLLNKKSELVNKCTHLNKFLLANVKNR